MAKKGNKKLVTKTKAKNFGLIVSAVATGVAVIGWVFFTFSGKSQVLDDARSGFQGIR